MTMTTVQLTVKHDVRRNVSEYSPRKTDAKGMKSRRDKTLISRTKVVVRKLPPIMTEEQFKEVIAPVPEHNYFFYMTGDVSLGAHSFSRAYLSFLNPEEVFTFKDKFDGYVFVDDKGNEYPGQVEFAPFQRIPKPVQRRKDPRSGTVEQDPDYFAFLHSLENPEPVQLPSVESILEDIEAHEKEVRANNGMLKVKTPLLEYIEHRKAERLRSKEEKREERRRRELERKRLREEEKKKKRESRETKFKKEEQAKTDRKQEYDYSYDKTYYDREKDRRVREEDRYKERENRTDKKLPIKRRYERLSKVDEVPETTEPQRKSQGGAEAKGGEAPVTASAEDRTKGEAVKSKRYSEVRKRDDREKKVREEKMKDLEDKEELPNSKAENNTQDGSKCEAAAFQQVSCEAGGQKKEARSQTKDPRLERRIRNKDRPAMQLYRPGQRRLVVAKSADGRDKTDGDGISSSSPSPVQDEGFRDASGAEGEVSITKGAENVKTAERTLHSTSAEVQEEERCDKESGGCCDEREGGTTWKQEKGQDAYPQKSMTFRRSTSQE